MSMYVIDEETNSISKIRKCSFKDLNYGEREHLQEWIAKEPNSLGEELLIIQKEFSGFSETNERLDLLALDKFGNLVIIENKLDDSGTDVTWQVIKYASYCSNLSKQEIIQIYQKYLGYVGVAEEKLSEFFNKDISEIELNKGANSQRLFLVAANFRKEVTSSVIWLLNYNLRIKCFKVTPYKLQEKIFLNFEQIIPMLDAGDYTIRMTTKKQEETQEEEIIKQSQIVRQKFWTAFLVYANGRSNLFINNSYSSENWLAKGIGLSGVNLNLVISKKSCRTEIYISIGSKELNKKVFDLFFVKKDEIETAFGDELIWERKDDKISCRIKSEIELNCYEEDNWNEAFDFLINTSQRLDTAIKKTITEISKVIKQF
ncbi:putative inner membrane protein [Mucinivorans hirudinis]|uniref:Putative inner membrane protein n=1 Tax=Mucinivorans hirudinis TaxID=1433126 RepID=A0A060R9P4_9BACT|nr:putative inner membrane protein [Mucinivorans hirudinis]